METDPRLKMLLRQLLTPEKSSPDLRKGMWLSTISLLLILAAVIFLLWVFWWRSDAETQRYQNQVRILENRPDSLLGMVCIELLDSQVTMSRNLCLLGGTGLIFLGVLLELTARLYFRIDRLQKTVLGLQKTLGERKEEGKPAS